MKKAKFIAFLLLGMLLIPAAFAEDPGIQKNDSASAVSDKGKSSAETSPTSLESASEKLVREILPAELSLKQAKQVAAELQEINAERETLTEEVAHISSDPQTAAAQDPELLLKARLATADLKKTLLEKKESFLREKIYFQKRVYQKLQDYSKTVFSEGASLFLINREIKELRENRAARIVDLLRLSREAEAVANRISVETRYLSAKDALLATSQGSERSYVLETVGLAEERLQTLKDIKGILDESVDFLKTRISGNEEFDKLLRLRRSEVFSKGLYSKHPIPYGLFEISAALAGLLFLSGLFLLRKRLSAFFRGSSFILRKEFCLGICWTVLHLGLISAAGYLGLNAFGFRFAARALGLLYLNVGGALVVFLSAALLMEWLTSAVFQKITKIRDLEVRKSSAVFSLLNTVFYIALFLAIFDQFFSYWVIRREMTEFLTGVINFPLLSAGGVELSIRILFRSALVLWVFFWLSRFINNFLENYVYPKTTLDRNSQHAVKSVVRFVVIAAGIVVSIQLLGVNLNALAVFSGTLGLGIGLGLQDIIKNIVSGFVIYFERPIRIGDVVEVGNTPGQVRSIRTRSTIINTFDNISIVVPNSEFLSERVVNWSLSDRVVRIEAKVGVAYGSDVEIVRRTLLEIAKTNDNIMNQPEPMVIFEDFADSALLFRLLFWVDVEDRMEVKSQINFAIYSRFKERGIEIPFPQRDVHIKSSIVPLQK